MAQLPAERDTQSTRLLEARARATDTRAGYAEQQNQAVAHMTEKYQCEVAGR